MCAVACLTTQLGALCRIPGESGTLGAAGEYICAPVSWRPEQFGRNIACRRQPQLLDEDRVTHRNAWRGVPASRWRVLAVSVSVVALAADCDSQSRFLPPTEFTAQFIATNRLIAPVTILVDGSPYAILSRGTSTPLTLSSRARVTWTSAKPADAHGHMIPDQIGEIRVSVPFSGELEITNLINDETYITASIFNHTSTPVSIGIYDGTSVACASQLPAEAQDVYGFTQTGYYRLSGAQFRAYSAPDCTGTYIAWPASSLAAYEPKSGRVVLTLDSAP